MTTTTTAQARPHPVHEPSFWDRQGDLIMRRPFNEWTFTHMNWLMPTEYVPRMKTRHLPLLFSSIFLAACGSVVSDGPTGTGVEPRVVSGIAAPGELFHRRD